ncbi:hypothetical protein E4U41_006737 [Claviceps citrina]|nr:hypothetical protein E4U41_006737 [Claviceps citrina]
MGSRIGYRAMKRAHSRFRSWGPRACQKPTRLSPPGRLDSPVRPCTPVGGPSEGDTRTYVRSACFRESEHAKRGQKGLIRGLVSGQQQHHVFQQLGPIPSQHLEYYIYQPPTYQTKQQHLIAITRLVHLGRVTQRNKGSSLGTGRDVRLPHRSRRQPLATMVWSSVITQALMVHGNWNGSEVTS